MATTVTLTASMYAPYSTTASISNPTSAYTDTSSTTYATITSSTNSTASRIYFYGFDFSQIPEGAVVTSMEFKIKISTTTSSTRYVSALYNRSINSTISSSVQSSTSAQVKTLTLTSLSYDDVIALGNSFAFGVTTYSTSVSQSVYGMEINVTYEIPVPPPEPVPNKVTYNGNTLIDLTGDTATEADVALGKIFHLANGEQTTGTGGGLEYETGTWSPSSNTTTAPTINFTNTHTEQPAVIAFADVSTSSRASNYFISYTYTNLALLIPDWAMPSGGSWKSKYHYYVYASSTSGETAVTPSSANISVSSTSFTPYINSKMLRASRVYNWIAIWV